VLIRNIEQTHCRGLRRCTATVGWEDNQHPDQHLRFEIDDKAGDLPDHGDHLLAACFPLALLHRERRISVDAPLCPMLVDGLFLVHAWWSQWGGLPSRAPRIESASTRHPTDAGGTQRSLSFLSGGVDSLHLLLRNRHLYRPGDPAYVRDVVFVHGLDIGKRRCAPELDRAERAFNSLRPVAEEMGARLIRGYTDLRHLPSSPGFWNLRHSGAATASFGHFATTGPAFLFIGGPTDIASLNPLGMHPAIDTNYSSQRVTVIHDGARFSRLDKVRQLVEWPAALAALRVCPANIGDLTNCGKCDKCLHTRLELLAVGCDHCAAFGETLMPLELLEEGVNIAFPYQATNYENALGPLRERGFNEICRVIERKLAGYRLAHSSPPHWSKDRTARSRVLAGAASSRGCRDRAAAGTPHRPDVGTSDVVTG
jgi:hypothetical protein